jgi:flavin-dependent dehydrogenase
VKETTAIVIGAGPAGSTCAGRLKQYGVDFLILDKENFPRDKPCAGWIHPGVFQLINRLPGSYPFTIHLFRRIIFHFPGFTLPVKTSQYSIRRSEFDYWLLKSNGIVPLTHKVESIRKEGDYYIVDRQWKARYVIGAGGTHCPVRKWLFGEKDATPSNDLIIGLATEARINFGHMPIRDCHLWFFEGGISGYSWYLPKDKQRVNIGIGARYRLLKSKNEKITDHWQHFVSKLKEMGWIVPDGESPRGHFYYLQHSTEIPHADNVFLIGDAAHVSTLDLGEGIYNAMKSGAMVADFIAGKRKSLKKTIRKYSAPGIIWPFL